MKMAFAQFFSSPYLMKSVLCRFFDGFLYGPFEMVVHYAFFFSVVVIKMRLSLFFLRLVFLAMHEMFII